MKPFISLRVKEPIFCVYEVGSDGNWLLEQKIITDILEESDGTMELYVDGEISDDIIRIDWEISKNCSQTFTSFMHCFTDKEAAKNFYIDMLNKRINAINFAMTKLEREKEVIEYKLKNINKV